MWGVVPAAGQGTRIQPLAFSKELLPVGVEREGGQERPRAISEYLVERLARGGATKVCFVISPPKYSMMSDLPGEPTKQIRVAPPLIMRSTRYSLTARGRSLPSSLRLPTGNSSFENASG
jgi:dTDP-glucose pyrophosphorylase